MAQNNGDFSVRSAPVGAWASAAPSSSEASRARFAAPSAAAPDPAAPAERPAPPAAAAIDPRLLVWLSPAFPVGAFAYSHGLELAASRGWVRDRAGLEAWLADLVSVGSLANDLILAAVAARAAARGDLAALREANELALALQPSAERHLEAVTQGRAFLDAVAAAWDALRVADTIAVLSDEVAYPIAVGAMSGAHGVEPAAMLEAYGLAAVSSLVSAAIRLSLIGQTDGQRIIAALVATVAASARRAATASLDDIGSATLRSDLASLAHETQYSRLFRS